MTVRMRLRRWARAQGKRRAAARTKRSTAAGSRRREQQTSGASQLRFLRLTVCGALFVSLVLLKLVLPGNLSAFRGTLAQWLVRDADFTDVSPLDGALTSGFGWREDPNTGEEAFHTGLDLAADEGTPFACFADGTVGVVGESTVLGKYLTVRHADGYETLYAHCSKIAVSSGQSVLRGDTLGAVGATGNATGAHLHFELLSGSKYLDPIAYAAKTV